MDSDGEDDPEAICELVKFENFDIVFVARGKRREGLVFKTGYFFYKILFKAIIGKQVNFGNYSMISPRVLKAVSRSNFMHYAAFLSKQRFRVQKIRFDRQSRIDGQSKMSLKGLIFHGLRSLIEYSEEVLYFMIKSFVALFVILFAMACFVLYSKVIAGTALPGWASTTLIGLLIMSLIVISGLITGLLLLSIKKVVTLDNEAYEEIK